MYVAINNYLVIGVDPANNETQVPVNKDITITFSKHMDVGSLTSSNLTLKVINGDVVPILISYNATSMSAKIIANYSNQLGMPAQALQAGTQYQLIITGGVDGIKSVLGDYMTVSRTYEFSTSSTATVTQPLDVTVTTDSGYPTVTWMKPRDFDITYPVTYEVMISTSNDPLNAPVWPATGDINQTVTNVLNVPKKLTEGTYYAYVRALNGSATSDWTMQQFSVVAPVVNPTPDPSEPSTGGGNIFSFDVVDTYPRRDDADITPEQIMIVFDGNVDPTTVTAGSVYIVKRQDKATLNLVDFMTNYAPSKAIPATINVDQALVTLTATLEDGAEYTVIIRESVKNDSGTNLGVAYHWSFVSKYTQLYGSAELVRQDIGSFSDALTDKVLYRYLKDSTDYVYQVASNASSFIPSNYTDGKAPYEVHQYVRYRTAYALLLNSQLHASGGSGSAFTKEIKLGDLTVQQEQSSAGSISISSVMGDLQDKMKLYMDMIQGHHNRGYAKPSVVVRGENIEAYPTFMTRAEYSDLGQ
jgi:hypothetical protein